MTIVECVDTSCTWRFARRREPDAAHDLGLTDIQRCDPLDDLLIVAGLCEHRTSPLSFVTAIVSVRPSITRL